MRVLLTMVVLVLGPVSMAALLFTDYGRWSGLVFVLMFVFLVLISKYVPRSAGDVAFLKKFGHARTSRRLRRSGYFYLAALVLGLLLWDYKRTPIWMLLGAVAIAILVIWSIFRTARRASDLSKENWDGHVEDKNPR